MPWLNRLGMLFKYQKHLLKPSATHLLNTLTFKETGGYTFDIFMQTNRGKTFGDSAFPSVAQFLYQYLTHTLRAGIHVV